jgi:integrase
MLAEHKAASRYSKPEDFVFASEVGGPMHYRNVVRRGLDKAVNAAKLDRDGRPKLRWHDSRHTAASLLIAQGLNVVHVSRALGHANPAITLGTYSHLWMRPSTARRHGPRWPPPSG